MVTHILEAGGGRVLTCEKPDLFLAPHPPHPPPPPPHLVSNFTGYIWFMQDISGLYKIYLVYTGYFWFIQDKTGLYRI